MSGFNINLLPKSRQQQLKYRSWYVAGVRIFSVGVASFIVMTIFLAVGNFYIKAINRNLENEVQDLQQTASSKENSELKKQIGEINNRIADYNNLAGGLPKWSGFLSKFASVVPEGVQIQSLSVDAVARRAQIQGFAPRRELVIALYELIKSDAESFEDIDYPLENVSRAENVNFHFTFIVKEDLLR